MPPNFNLTETTLEAIRCLVLLGFPTERFGELHHGGIGLVSHYKDARDNSTGVYGRGGNQATAARLWSLMTSAQEALDAADPRPQPSALTEHLTNKLTPWSTSEVRTVHRLDLATWTDLIAAALGVPHPPPAGRPPSRRRAAPLPPPARPAPQAGHGVAADTRSGFYVVRLRNLQPMRSQQGDRESIQVCRGWVKVGETDSFARRMTEYQGTFDADNVVFRPIAQVPPEQLANADRLVRAAHRPWRRDNPAKDGSALTEWMNGLSVNEAVEITLLTLQEEGVDHEVLWDGQEDAG